MSDRSSQQREQTLERLIARANRLFAKGEQWSLFLSRWRLGIFITAFLVCATLYKLEWFHSGNMALALFLLLFLAVAYYHNGLEHRLHRLRVWRTVKQSNLARLRLDWEAIPRYDSPIPRDHPYAVDLDIAGPHSILHLVDSAISSFGHERLASWFFDQNHDPLDLEQWAKRQALVKELARLALLRDRLRLESKLIHDAAIDGKRIEALLQAPVDFPSLLPVLIIAAGLAGLTVLLFLANAIMGLPGYWGISFAIYAGLSLIALGWISPVFGRVLALHDELAKLGVVIRLFERRSFRDKPHLATVCSSFTPSHIQPSQAIRMLARICHGLSVRAHPLIHLAVNAVLPWDLWLTYRLDRACTRLRPLLPVWLDCLATLDAAASLGEFAYVNPTYQWATLRPREGSGTSVGLRGRAMGHPLIPASRRVCNDLEIQGLGQLLLVTGSNMSGKSTFLRTVGVNICLAQAGAPVCADAFEWTWMRLFCCIRVNDSLEEGLSYFYTEVKRLKSVLHAVSDRDASAPVMFLVDEIFKGTNNRERLIGSQAFIRAIVSGHGLGLITTHDLELVQLEQELPGVTNVHFQETVERDKLRFDYRLRQGPCPTTNALRIMAQEGLPVPELND